MAKADFKMPDDFLMKLSKLGDKTDEIIPKVLEAGGEIVLDKVRSNLAAVIGSNMSIYSDNSRSTGELINALGISSAKMDKDGNWNIKVGFREPRSDGKSNAKIATILEYGKHNQPARPFLAHAKSQSRTACIDAMKSKLESEVESM